MISISRPVIVPKANITEEVKFTKKEEQAPNTVKDLPAESAEATVKPAQETKEVISSEQSALGINTIKNASEIYHSVKFEGLKEVKELEKMDSDLDDLKAFIKSNLAKLEKNSKNDNKISISVIVDVLEMNDKEFISFLIESNLNRETKTALFRLRSQLEENIDLKKEIRSLLKNNKFFINPEKTYIPLNQ